MKLWRKASGAIKDKNSIIAATLSRRTPFRHPELESIIVKATSHDSSKLDYHNFRLVFQWLRTSPIYLKPLAFALSSRLDKTRSWVVAIKGLMLIHGLISCQIPSVQRITQLPFDLSNFTSRKTPWTFDAFIRGYYVFLDHKFSFVISQKNPPLLEDLQRLQKWQAMLEMLLQIRPPVENNKKQPLVFEAMNNLLVEVFDVYSKICNGIPQVLLKIYASPVKDEAAMALDVIQKAKVQVDDLSLYFQRCEKMGVLNVSQCPKLEKISEDDIRELEGIINGTVEEEKMAIVVREREDSKGVWKSTVITEKWEIFDGESSGQQSPFAAQNLIVSRENLKPDLPDLITF